MLGSTLEQTAQQRIQIIAENGPLVHEVQQPASELGDDRDLAQPHKAAVSLPVRVLGNHAAGVLPGSGDRLDALLRRQTAVSQIADELVRVEPPTLLHIQYPALSRRK
jgi:hypothetical protein